MGSQGGEDTGAGSKPDGGAGGGGSNESSNIDRESSSIEGSSGVDTKASKMIARIVGEMPEAKIPALPDNQREVSASTIGRMMGLATALDLKLLEGKLDLLASRVNNLTIRMEKVLSMLGQTPTGSDMERIDVQIGSLKTLMKELLVPGYQGEEHSSATSDLAGPKDSRRKTKSEEQRSEISTDKK